MPCGAGRLSCAFRDDWWVQGRSDDQRELLEAESVAGHLLKGDNVFAFWGRTAGSCFPRRSSPIFSFATGPPECAGRGNGERDHAASLARLV